MGHVFVKNGGWCYRIAEELHVTWQECSSWSPIQNKLMNLIKIQDGCHFQDGRQNLGCGTKYPISLKILGGFESFLFYCDPR